jgi:prophage regulatory protein
LRPARADAVSAPEKLCCSAFRKRDLPDFVGLKRTQIETLIERGDFPKPIRLSERAIGFLESEIALWQQRRIAKRDGGER